ncbi:MAG TPA: tRNA (5-methylaminomethyl-2-thiouridine)(34)-methyltransferase MnmD [Flavisolibacter sp.]|nr:tRNA (5-methylaminomethyl-2-thiouridine)(34)-methyltransferase MnmD [Flavisolibacter sp.]
MERKIIITEDGSHSIAIPEWNVIYHSIHGAIQESKHIFIEAGLNYILNNSPKKLSILEMGLGTGLNVLLTAIESEGHDVEIHYTAIEQFPISVDEAKSLNYAEVLHYDDLFEKIHDSEWAKDILLSEHFIIRKENIDLVNYLINNQFDLVYYDAFAPAAQPELWTKDIFQKLFFLLKPNGVLVTYCSKGDVRRAMMAAGFLVKKLPGPQGKREILRAEKIN